MDNNKPNVPKLRFPGFTEPWEQRKLGDLFYEATERSSELEILSVSISNGVYPASESERDTNPGASIVNYKIVCVGDIVYNSMRMWQGAVDASSHNGIVSPAYVVAKPKSPTFPRFFSRLLKRPQMLHKFHSISQGNSKDTLMLKFDQFAKIPVCYPAKKEEQKRIAASFDEIDSLITLHQRKLEHLQKLKKGLLQKMFPKDGETVPEIRFPGFTDPWERRKLGECGTTFGGLSGKTKEDFGHGEARFVPYTNVFDNPIADAGRLEAIEIDPKQNAVKFGDVFFTTSSETPEEVGMSSVWLSEQPNVYLNSFCFGYRQDGSFDTHYLAYMLRSQSMRNSMTLLAQGISRFNISKKKVMELEVSCPQLEEQTKIGTYFSKLDSLITLHQRKAEHLQQLKKGLLQQMFV